MLKQKKEKIVSMHETGGLKDLKKNKPSKQETTPSKQETFITTPLLTSYNIFHLCIERAKNLVKIHEAAHGKQSKPEKYLSDAHRAAIVLSISALDAFVRTFLIHKIRELIADKSKPLPGPLSDQIKKFIQADELLEAARKDDLLDRVEKVFRNDFEKKSFQGTKIITESMKLIGYGDILHGVAVNANINEDALRADLDKFTQRRHLIAHRGDYDLNQNPPKENIITKKDTEDCIKLVQKIAKHINEI